MTYLFTLQEVALFLGAVYLLSHGLVLLRPVFCRRILLAAPRNEVLGCGLLGAAALWFVWLMYRIDLMEYTPYRKIFVLVSLVGTGLVMFYLRELLTGRAVGCLLLLLAYVILDVAFLRDEVWKLVLVGTAYIYVVAGMVLVSSPYRLRDFITWIYAKEKRAQAGAVLGVVFGLLLIYLGWFVF
jgi:hypothetical protein